MNFKKISMHLCFVYIILCFMFYFIAGDQLKYTDSEALPKPVEASDPIGEIVKGNDVYQAFRPTGDALTSISLKFATYNRKNSGDIQVKLIDDNKDELYDVSINKRDIKDNEFYKITFDKPITLKNTDEVAILISSYSSDKSQAVTIWYNNKVQGNKLKVANIEKEGMLCFTYESKNISLIGEYYFVICAILLFILLVYIAISSKRYKAGKNTALIALVSTYTKYKFLLNQLVLRDFKSKYKRSILGILWSFLNPLLTMIVQYVVFANLFKFNIDNFAVYLLSGIVFFNFFSEATTLAMTSITGNSTLINKVYVPKYIFPISRVISSVINLVLSIIPLILVMVLTGCKFTPAILLLPYGIICIILFSIGISFILSSLMVFFRDTQFIWSVLTMIWMYLTPIIYPESILTKSILYIVKLNPLYHFIGFIRTILLQGVSPEPISYLICGAYATVVFFIGAYIFKRSQDKFIIKL